MFWAWGWAWGNRSQPALGTLKGGGTDCASDPRETPWGEEAGIELLQVPEGHTRVGA